MSEPLPHVDSSTLAELRDLLGPAASETIRRLVTTFREQQDRVLADARSALDRHDESALARAAHVLKGSCRQLGIARSAEFAALVEGYARSGELEHASSALDDLEDELGVVDPMLDEL